ncbi:lysylphosphatidylglycerol synthase transmembrane domain-containing protein [Calditrichota bacterium]
MQQTLKNKLAYLAKFSIGIILVGWILSGVDKQKVIEYFLSLDLLTLFFILFFSILTVTIQLLRWKYLVICNSSDFDFKDILPSFFAGYAFRLMIPGGHAEISKIFLLPGKKRGKAVAFAMEKFFQTYIKLVLIVIVLPISFPAYRILFYVLMVFLFLALFLLPKIGWLKFLQEKEVNNIKVFFNTLVYSLGIFLIMVIQYFILLNQVNEINFFETMHTVVYLWGSGIIPISISGLGVREGLAVYFLNFYGIYPAHAVATSLFLFCLNTIVPALIGVFYIYKKRQHLKDMKDTVKSTRSLWKELRNNRKINK